MHSIRLRMNTRIVAGHRRMISSTVMTGSIVRGGFTLDISKENQKTTWTGPELCAGANNASIRVVPHSAATLVHLQSGKPARKKWLMIYHIYVTT